MFERFTARARESVMLAQTEARNRGHGHIGSEHVLMGMLRMKESLATTVLAGFGVTAEHVDTRISEGVRDVHGLGGRPDPEALASIGIDLDEVRRRVEETFGPGALDRAGVWDERERGWRAFPGHIPFTPGAKKLLELSLREALALRHNYIGTEHILLGLLREGRGGAARILRDAGVSHAEARKAILSRLQGATGT
jgi:ATP-dependent Clp protease ATP-binding subunit ClpA